MLSYHYPIQLDLSVWFCHLPGVHEREHLGYVLQQHYLAVSRLWGLERIRESVNLAISPKLLTAYNLLLMV